MPIELTLAIVSLLTSAVAGVFGFGGGMLLIAILPLYLAPTLIIPIHGITQLASNASRTVFSLRDVQWSLLPPFLVGSLAGVVLFGLLLVNIPTDTIPVAIGAYIILNLWSQRFANAISKYENYTVIGALQTGLGLIVGATGPLATSVLTKQLSCKNEIIATASLFMSISHLSKIIIFGLIGFSFSEHLTLLGAMVAASILGSYLGTQLRGFIGNKHMILFIKVLLSVLAVRMIIVAAPAFI